MYKKILLTTDGSEGAETAINHAKKLAQKFDAKLHVLYVIDVRDSTHDMSDVLSGKFKELGEKTTEEIKGRLEDSGVDAEAHVERGVPHRTILEFSEEKGIDMVVMSTHGRTGLDRILIGSVTEKVVRNSEVPVLTVGRES